MKQTFSLALLLFLFVHCKNEPTTPTPPKSVSPETTTDSQNQPLELIVNIDNIRFRDAAGPDGKELAKLPVGTKLTDLGEISEFTTKVKLRGIEFDEPWIKVKNEQGMEGWVFGGGVHFNMNDQNELAKVLMERRLKVLFGGLSNEVLAYHQNYKEVKSAEEFAHVYKQGTKLRDTIVQYLEEKIPVLDYEKLPDLFWLEEVMPAYLPALAAEGTIYYLFKDYQELQRKALKTSGKEDDAYVELMLQVHDVDSVEYFFPSWFLQTWDYGGYSLLGQGIHTKMLKQLEETKFTDELFKDQRLVLKDELMNDMTDSNVEYGETSVNIINEIEGILQANFSVLSKNDILELKERKNQFKDPKKNKIVVNLRAGYE